MLDIAQWLDSKIAELVQSPGYFEEPAPFIGKALGLKTEALRDGYSEKELIEACCGDVARYMMEQQNAFTDAHLASGSPL